MSDHFFTEHNGYVMRYILEHERVVQLGQRCHIEGVGFGTIIKIERKPSAGGDTLIYLRVECDAGGSSWYELADVELIPTYPAL